MSIYIFIKLIRDPNNNMPLREWSLFMGRGEVVGKWEGRKPSYTLINRGDQKSFNAEKGGSITTNSKKEDSENAISNDLETQNFQNFPALRQSWLRLMGVGPTKFNKLPTP
jgi:hypothetical protein